MRESGKVSSGGVVVGYVRVGRVRGGLRVTHASFRNLVQYFFFLDERTKEIVLSYHCFEIIFPVGNETSYTFCLHYFIQYR